MELSFVTSNEHKFQEMKAKLSLPELNLNHRKMSYPEIQADTIKDVARYSLAVLIPTIKGNFVIEDAGLEIETLNGFPGPYSSFVYNTIGWEGILDLLEDENNRVARFQSIIGLVLDGESYFFHGTCEGTIARKGMGKKGFGFDPIFIPRGYEQTFAQLELGKKNKISHRGKSIDRLKKFLQSPTDRISDME